MYNNGKYDVDSAEDYGLHVYHPPAWDLNEHRESNCQSWKATLRYIFIDLKNNNESSWKLVHKSYV